MARRMILGRRGSEYGLWISKAGFDAATAADANLLFSMSRRHGMIVASGTVVCPNNGNSTTVSFGFTAPSVPLVFCGVLTRAPSEYPVRTVASQTGFTVSAIQIWDGSYPAGGRTLRWFAASKNQDA